MKASSHLVYLCCTIVFDFVLRSPIIILRFMRPGMIDEYGINFQQHLVNKYGKKLWSDEDLNGWIKDNTRSFVVKKAFRKFLENRGA